MRWASEKKRRSPTENRRLVEKWNAAHPQGARVRYYPVHGVATSSEFSTASGAMLLNETQAVIFLDGKRGCVSLWHVEVIEGGVP